MAVQYHTVTEHEAGQRIDNFLLRFFKQVPKSVIYRIIRKGEVRVNKKRVKPTFKLSLGEEVRIPPVKVDVETDQAPRRASQRLLQKIEQALLLEDEHIIVLDKPSGIPAHSGSNHEFGVIELFRQLRPSLAYVELAHRIDLETSGLLLLAKSRPALNALNQCFRDGVVDKQYLALVAGQWRGGERHITTTLKRQSSPERSQKVRVQADGDEGQEAESIFTPQQVWQQGSLMQAKILTGRMHQIRVQLAHLNHPILGDDRYGDFALNRKMKTLGLKRMFLHAASMTFTLPTTGQRYCLQAPLPPELKQFIEQMK